MINQTLIIAEAGVNHNGDIELARRLIDAAAETGADLVKFQTFTADHLVTRSAEKAEYQNRATDGSESQHDMLCRLELSADMHTELINHCAMRGIGFCSSPFDIGSVELLIALGQNIFKIPSGEITNLPYLRAIGSHGKKVILSTGMASMGEIEAAIEVLGQSGMSRSDITALHCTTHYPAPMADVNLRAMESIRAAFGVAVGYSDHTSGIEVAIAAVAIGAEVIEKHLTVDRRLLGPDHQASLEPVEFKKMVESIRNIEWALGDGIKRIAPCEEGNRGIVRKSLVAGRRIKAGELLTAENVTCKRPGAGISPMLWDEVIGRKAPRDFGQDEFIEL